MKYTPQAPSDNLAGTKAEADEEKRLEREKAAERAARTAAHFEHG